MPRKTHTVCTSVASPGRAMNSLSFIWNIFWKSMDTVWRSIPNLLSAAIATQSFPIMATMADPLYSIIDLTKKKEKNRYRKFRPAFKKKKVIYLVVQACKVYERFSICCICSQQQTCNAGYHFFSARKLLFPTWGRYWSRSQLFLHHVSNFLNNF